MIQRLAKNMLLQFAKHLNWKLQTEMQMALHLGLECKDLRRDAGILAVICRNSFNCHHQRFSII